jgi:hypothetical protein
MVGIAVGATDAATVGAAVTTAAGDAATVGAAVTTAAGMMPAGAAPLVEPPPEQAVPTAMQPTIAPTARSKDCRTLPPKYDGDVLKVTEADGALRGA